MSSNNRLVTVEDDDDFDVDNMDFDLPADAGPSSSTPYSASQPLSAQQQTLLSQFTGASGSSSHPAGNTRVIPTSEVGRFKHYVQLYPIYLDARRPHKNGERRVSKAKSVPYPKAQEIAEVCGRFLGIEPVLEPEKTHPKDWENPGRVRVLLKHKESGQLVNPDIPDKYTLLNKVGEIIKRLRAQNGIDPLKSSAITARLPYLSPAISFGSYAESLKGGGKMEQMMQGMGMMGAPPPEDDGEAKKRQEEKELLEKQKMAKMKALQKQGRRVVRR